MRVALVPPGTKGKQAERSVLSARSHILQSKTSEGESMGEPSVYRDAYGQRATIRDEGRGRYPYRLKVYSPRGGCSYNAVFASYRAARAALNGQGYCWATMAEKTA